MDVKNVFIIGRFRKCLDAYDILCQSPNAYQCLGVLSLDAFDRKRFEGPVFVSDTLQNKEIMAEIFRNTNVVIIDDAFYEEIKVIVEEYNPGIELIRHSDAFDKLSCEKACTVDKLCILIPTYNRLNHIQDTLNMLDKQTVDKSRFEIVVVDNASSYAIEELEAVVPAGLKNNTTVYRNACNIGLTGTIANLFLRGTQKWCWHLADDDTLPENAVETIIKDIERFGTDDLGVLQYLHFDLEGLACDEYFQIDSLESFAQSFYSLVANENAPLSYVQGTLIYLANKVYNMEVIAPFVQYAFTYANTMIPMDMPILKGLETHQFKMVHHNFPILEYSPGRVTWNMKVTSLGLSTIKYLDLKVDKETLKFIIALFNFSMDDVFLDYAIVGITDPDYLETIYNNAYRHFLSGDADYYFKKIIELSKDGEEMFYLWKRYEIKQG